MKNFISKNIAISILLLVGNFAQGQQNPNPSPGSNSTAVTQAPVGLDRTLRPGSSDEVTSLFDNVVAVQRKAKQKAGKFLLAPIFSFDFSDAPFTMYNLNIGLGYAIGEFWEVYLNYTPAFLTNERNISKQVKSLELANGQQANIETEKAKSAYGLDINWVPIYGKDSWGPYGIVRSDTFIHLGVGQIKYERNTGTKINLSLGKTFFFSDYWNMRIQAGPSSIDTFSQGKKQNIFIGLIDAGLVYYF